MLNAKPEQWAIRQFDLDRERTRRFPQLLARKIARMSASPFAFLRGAAPLFYEILGSSHELADGPAGEGWLVGDLHLENFGAFSPTRTGDETSEKRAATFGLNDFDDAVRGPWRWDVLRLLTSLILAGRELGKSGPEVLALSSSLLESYVDSAFLGAPLPPRPAPVAALVERVRARSRREFLDARTTSDGARRKFLRGDRYGDLPPEILEQLPRAIESYALRLASEERPRPEQLEIVDAAHRVAGTGSLGVLRVAVLTRGKGDVDGGWIFDMKEQPGPSAARLVAPSSASPADDSVTACRACVELPPRMLGTTAIGSLELVVRRLTPQEDRLALRHLDPEGLAALAAYLGALVGAAHQRGGGGLLSPPWSERERFDLVHRAVTLAALHESIYLEWCLLLPAQA